MIETLAAIEPAAAARPLEVRVVRAPGRVNLMGEHTDYNDGLVLPMAIDREIRIASISTDDRRVELTRVATGERLGFDLDAPREPDGTWLDYVAGTAAALTAAGLEVGGLRGIIESDLPEAAGLASSAAIELASAWALLGPAARDIDPMQLAQICQRAENRYVGVQSGLMDQFAVANGVPGHALLLDCRSLDWRPVPLPDELVVVVCHTGFQRRLDGSAYNLRRRESEAAVAALGRIDPAIESLRDVTADHLAAARHGMDPVVARRAEHVVAENDRVLAMVDALLAVDTERLGELLRASHASLRDLYEVSSPALDALVEIAEDVPGVIGARMTGAGFGGCTVNLVRRESVGDLRSAVMSRYAARTGLTPTVIPVAAAGGAGLR